MGKMTPVDKGSAEGTNPYNQKKAWDGEGKTGESFVSADDSMAYKKVQKVAILDKMEDTPEVEAVQEAEHTEEGDSRYKTVDYKKRYDDLKRHYDKKLGEFKTKEKSMQETIASNEPRYTPPSTPEELERFKDENPSLYNVVETVAHMRSSTELTTLKEELKTVQESLKLEEANRAYAELKVLVPDFEQIRQSNEFHEWAELQPDEIQNWVYKNRTDVRLAAQAINLYKASIGMQQPAVPATTLMPQARQAGADEQVSPRASREEPTSQERVWTAAEIASLSTTQFEQYRAEIDKAFAEGRVSRD